MMRGDQSHPPGAGVSGAGWSGEGSVAAPLAPAGLGPRYVREGLIGVGGMGRVYRAWDHRLGRPVALKVAAREGLAAQRLAREARITAGLDHPGVVSVHDSGTTEEGLPFYAMRLIHGRALSEVIAERPALPDRLDLLRHFLQAAEAVAAAHRQGVVHRDLKPANIMVGELGETQVVDWGLAINIREEEPVPGEIVGTPGFMSPEQARGEAVDRRSDVWSLGAILRALLAGPADEETTLPGLPLDLLAIANKALQDSPALRYAEAGALAADLAAWLDGRPVAAHSYGPWELARRLLRAWKAPLRVALAAMALGAVLIAAGTARLSAARDRAVDAEEGLRRALSEADHALVLARVAQAQHAVERGDLATAAALATATLHQEESPGARGVLAALGVLAPSSQRWSRPLPACALRVLVGPNDALCAEAGTLWRQTDGVERWRIPLQVGALSLRENIVVATLLDASAQAIDLESGQRLTPDDPAGSWLLGAGAGRPALTWQSPPGTDPNFPLQSASQACDPAGLYAASTRIDARLQRWVMICPGWTVHAGPLGGPADRRVVVPIGAGGDPAGAAISPDGRSYVIGTVKGALVKVDLFTGEATVAAPRQTEALVAPFFSGDGRRVALRADRGEVEVRDLATLGPLARLPVAGVVDGRFLPDGELLLATREELSRWTLPATVTRAAAWSAEGLTSAVFSPDGSLLATSHAGGQIALWALPSLDLLHRVDLGDLVIKPLAFGADGRQLFATSLGLPGEAQARSRVIDPRTGAVGPALHPVGGYRLLPLRDGALLQSWAYPGLAARDMATGRPVGVRDCPPVSFRDMARSPDGRHGVLVGAEGLVVRVESDPARCAGVVPTPKALTAAIDSRGEALLIGIEEGITLVSADGQRRWTQPFPAPGPLDVALSPDGRWAAAAGKDGHAYVYDQQTGALRAELVGHGERVVGVDFSPDSERLATASWDGTARLWSMTAL